MSHKKLRSYTSNKLFLVPQYLAVKAWKPFDESYLEKTGQLKKSPALTKETLQAYVEFSAEKSPKTMVSSMPKESSIHRYVKWL